MNCLDKRLPTANYHTHTARCNHAIGEDREYVEAAIKGGLKILGFSDHSPYVFDGNYYSNMRMTHDETYEYISSLKALREEYKNQIEIHIGFEMEYYPDLFEKTLDFLNRFDYEYLILGQHWLNNEIGELPSTTKTEEPKRLAQYVDQCTSALKSGKFSCFAHPDVLNFTGDEKIYRREMHRLCGAAFECDVPLEINMLGIRGNRHYPCEIFWEEAARVGNEVLCGFDAHDPAWLYDAEPYMKALDIVDRYGLKLLDTLPRMIRP